MYVVLYRPKPSSNWRVAPDAFKVKAAADLACAALLRLHHDAVVEWVNDPMPKEDREKK